MSIRERLDNRAQLSKIRYFLRKSCRRSNSFFFSPGLKQKRTFQSRLLCRVTADIQTRPARAKRCRARCERNRKYAFGYPSAGVRHVEPPLSPNGRTMLLGRARATHNNRKELN